GKVAMRRLGWMLPVGLAALMATGYIASLWPAPAVGPAIAGAQDRPVDPVPPAPAADPAAALPARSTQASRSAGARINPAPHPLEVAQPGNPFPVPVELADVDYTKQTAEQAHAKSAGCLTCHENSHDPHYSPAFSLGCVDCHGGNPGTTDKLQAHVPSCLPDAWPTSANPVRSYTLLNHESPEFVRFVNPSDLRVAHLSCGT
ncbi:MAG: hypothetical protein ACKOJF_19685, partial [Planctomycetaceae bacterium]